MPTGIGKGPDYSTILVNVIGGIALFVLLSIMMASWFQKQEVR